MLLKSFFISASHLVDHGPQYANDTADSQFDSFNHFNKDDFLHEGAPSNGVIGLNKLRAIKSFVRIVESGSLTAAATDLNVTLPSMVRMLAALGF